MTELADRLRIALVRMARADELMRQAQDDMQALAQNGVIARFSDGRYVWVPDTWESPLRCVAQTMRGTRCKNPVFYGQEYRWHEDSTVEYSPSAERAIRMQVCRTHDDGTPRSGQEWVSVS